MLLNDRFWAPGEPNYSGGNEKCIQTGIFTQAAMWNDLNCANKLNGVICEFHCGKN